MITFSDAIIAWNQSGAQHNCPIGTHARDVELCLEVNVLRLQVVHNLQRLQQGLVAPAGLNTFVNKCKCRTE